MQTPSLQDKMLDEWLVHSSTEQRISIQLYPVLADVITSFCHLIYFFSSLEAGQAWAQKHPGTVLFSREEGLQLSKQKNEISSRRFASTGLC